LNDSQTIKTMLKELKLEIRRKANQQKAKLLQGFFKTGKGEYGEGDLFLGIVVPESRKIVKKFKDLSFSDLSELIKSEYHEERLIALLILVSKFEKGNEAEKSSAYKFYIKNRKGINNWDLVDLTASKIAGPYLQNKDKTIIYKFAKSKDIWERRIAVLSCFHYIYYGDCRDALKIAQILKNDKHDLIQKAVGWMLREVGKRCGKKFEEEFLKKNCKTMPRVMLRYAIEKFPEKLRRFYLKNKARVAPLT
jgi:3-methyladenine DNA glycosylase AlkD